MTIRYNGSEQVSYVTFFSEQVLEILPDLIVGNVADDDTLAAIVGGVAPPALTSLSPARRA